MPNMGVFMFSMFYLEIFYGKPLLRKHQILMKILEGLVKTLVKDIEERRNICLDQANPFHKELQTMLATYK